MDSSLDGIPMIPCRDKNVSAVDNKDGQVNIYIWDMDETLILLKSLLDGTYGRSFNGSKDIQKGNEIGKRWENHILQLCDEYFFYEQIENYNEPFLDATNEYDDGRDLSDYDFNNDVFSAPYDDANKRKLAYRHRIIAQKYAQGLHHVLDEGMIELWNDLYDLTDSYTDGWLSSARAFLEQISDANKGLASHLVSSDSASDCADTKCQNVNVLVTSGSLIPSLAKCLLFRLDGLIPHGNVYSSWEVGKHQCFLWIKQRFHGAAVRFCVIGDGLEECEAARAMRWPFIKIDMRSNGTHRFPGLTMGMLGHYMGVIYRTPAVEEKDEQLPY